MTQLPNAIYGLLKSMPSKKAGDLFVSAGKKPFFRILNSLHEARAEAVGEDEVSEFMRLVLDSSQQRIFSDRKSCDVGFSLEPRLRYRINFFVRQGAPSFAARLISSADLSFEDLFLPHPIKALAERSGGLVILCGPASSGKSTTAASMVNHINANFAKHIITIEDPVEYLYEDKKGLVTQRQIGSDAVDFARALKDAVRESPDVIVIGEMRDLETIHTALNAALTGHLVISTLHTSDVTQCVGRIVNYFPDHLRAQIAVDLSIALEGIVAHRLLPSADGTRLYPALEILIASPLVRKTLGERRFGELEDLMKRGYEEGMRTFARSLADLCSEGRITVEKGASAAPNKEEFLFLVQGMESGVESFRVEIAREGTAMLDMKRLLHSAIRNEASDIVMTAGSPPFLRVDGEMRPLDTAALSAADIKELLFGILNQGQRKAFEERREMDFSLTVNMRHETAGGSDSASSHRFRVNCFFQRGNAAAAIRLIPEKIPLPSDLGLPKALVELACRMQGLLLVTGPTGHGKSTTLASLVNVINSTRPCHIITIEDPIEYVHANKKAVVEQRELHSDTLSFSNALKYVLRQAPDVILIGEMRDSETIAAALTAAETGHLVFATLHTNNCAQSVDRIIDSFPSHQQNQIRMQLSGSLLGIVSQRLLRRRDGKGRVAAFELLVGNSAVKALIRDGKTHLIASAIDVSAKDGMISMDRCLKDMYEKNIISRREALSYVSSSDAW